MMETSLIELIQSATLVFWGIPIPQYFFLTGISAAAFLISSLTYVFGDKRYEPIAGLALIVALTVLIVAPLNLIADLGQPGRFYSLLYRLHATSPMSWGVFLLSSYPLLIVVEMLFVFRAGFARRGQQASGGLQRIYTYLSLGSLVVTKDTDARDHRVGRILGIIGIPTALAVHGYTGYILGVVRARPMWHTSLMPLIFLISAMVSGIALMILLTGMMVRNRDGSCNRRLLHQLGVLLAWSIVGDLTLRILWYTIGLFYAANSYQDVIHFLFVEHFSTAILLELGLGLLFPLCVMAIPPLRRIRPLFWSSTVLAVAGVMLFRWDTVIGGQLIPKYAAGLGSFEPEVWGRAGLMHILGNWGLWVFLFLLCTSVLPWVVTSTPPMDTKESKDTAAKDELVNVTGVIS